MMAGRWVSSITLAMVKVLPVPVAPRSTWFWSRSLIPCASSAIAVGWSPAGSNSECMTKRLPPSSLRWLRSASTERPVSGICSGELLCIRSGCRPGPNHPPTPRSLGTGWQPSPPSAFTSTEWNGTGGQGAFWRIASRARFADNHVVIHTRSAMRARIFRPAKSAMSSGTAKTKEWVLEFVPASARSVDPLMGWTSSSDMNSQLRLRFDTLEAAREYAADHGIDAVVVQPKTRKPNIRPRGYGENFATDRRGAWTH
jgi:hypothetical protein